jgi:hypothetical protein
VASQHYEQVRMTVQAMMRRGVSQTCITVSAVSKEAGVSAATIYRRHDLFGLIQQANPALQRRIGEQEYRQSLRQLQDELSQARSEVIAAKIAAQEARLGERGPQQEILQLKKTLLALQRQIASLEALLARCTCGVHSNDSLS